MANTSRENARRLMERIGHVFDDESLFWLALTHRSKGSPNNERMEFLGDSLLNCVIAHLLYERFPRLPEGDLSRLRAHLVKAQTLGDLAARLMLGDLLQLGEGELKSGGYRRPSILADSLEALFGAIYLDAGFDAVQRVITALYSDAVSGMDWRAVGKDAKTLLQEWVQGRRLPLPVYTVLAVTGEAHEQVFRVECVLESIQIRSEGEGRSRRAAEQAAAMAAYSEVLTARPGHNPEAY